METPRQLKLYGTAAASPTVEVLEAGPLRVELEGGSLRYIRFGGHEGIRGIDYLVRDANWGSPPARLEPPEIERRGDGFTVRLRGVVAADGIDYAYSLLVEGHAGGRLSVTAEGRAAKPFLTNRTGFTVLHPVTGVAGEPVTIEHGDGSTEEGRFPLLVSPGQPIFDVRALKHRVADGLWVTCRMEADLPGRPAAIFEMEDQRNWSDASYKTYVGSLLDPWPYEVPADETLRQRITVTFEGTAPAGVGARSSARFEVVPTERRVPTIGVGLMPDDVVAATAALARLRRLRPPLVTAHIDLREAEHRAQLADFASLARELGAAVALELTLPEGRSPGPELEAAAAACRAAGLAPTSMLACPAPYLQSVQPSGPWPEVVDLAHIYNRTRAAFPEADIVGGMLSYFTELNRKRPPAACIDAISCTTSPLVHAADDRSVMETLEALPMITASMRAMAPGLPVHLGPSSLAMRHNPYGTDTLANPEGARLAMARSDPRQGALFGAAWTVGYAAAVAADVDRLVLHHLAGASGIVADADEPGVVRPIFHVMRALTAASEQPLSFCEGLPGGLAGLAWREGDETRLLIANLGETSVSLGLDRLRAGRVLDAAAFDQAIADPDWLETTDALDATVELDAFAVLFA